MKTAARIAVVAALALSGVAAATPAQAAIPRKTCTDTTVSVRQGNTTLTVVTRECPGRSFVRITRLLPNGKVKVLVDTFTTAPRRPIGPSVTPPRRG